MYSSQVAANRSQVTINQQASKPASSLISDNNKKQLQKFLQQLTLKAYSPSTIRTYSPRRIKK
jgi:hypothetical protein